MKTVLNRNCGQIQDDLLAYRHRELAPLSRAVVGWHLLHCPACRKEIETMKHIHTTLAEAEAARDVTVLSADLRETILSRLPDAPESATRQAVIPARRASWAGWSTLAAATCVLVVVAFVSLQGGKVRNTFNAAGNQMTSGDVSAAPSAESARSKRSLDGANYAFTDGHVQWLKKQPASAGAMRSQYSGSRKSGDSAAINGISGAASTSLTSLRRVHKQGSLTVEVEEIETGSDAVEEMVKKAGGFVANSTLSTEKDGLKTAALEIRVPVTRFEAILKQIAALGNVKAKRVQGEDITAKVSDANEENNVLANDLRLRLRQYQQAKEKAARKDKNVPDDWQRRQEIRQMRIQLAQVRARLDLLKKLSEFAELSVQLREKPGQVSGGGFLSDIGHTGRAAVASFLVAARLPVNLLIYILTYSPFWIPILLVWRYFARSSTRVAPKP
jgi:prepilin-type processing-associated H-X9-DG protein